jgi:hypothetical protein
MNLPHVILVLVGAQSVRRLYLWSIVENAWVRDRVFPIKAACMRKELQSERIVDAAAVPWACTARE